MIKINRALVKRYINGESVVPFKVEDLENNPEFMEEVLISSKDKKYYEKCSTAVKGNFDFAIKIMTFFMEDKEFVKEVASQFISNNPLNEEDTILEEIDDDEEVFIRKRSQQINELFEVIALAAIATLDEDYVARTVMIYNVECEIANAYVNNLSDEEDLESFGYGFWLIQENYANTPIMLYVLAKFMLVDILEGGTTETIEDIAHRKFRNVLTFQKYGITNFLLDVIRSKDSFLADYVTAHTDLLAKYVEQCEVAIKEWPSYILKMDLARRKSVDSWIAKFKLKFDVPDLPTDAILKEVVDELGLASKFDFSELTETSYNPRDVMALRFKRDIRQVLTILYSEYLVNINGKTFSLISQDNSN